MKKDITSFSMGIAVMGIVLLCGCQGKGNQEKQPNIDSLVEAKVAEKMKEATANQQKPDDLDERKMAALDELAEELPPSEETESDNKYIQELNGNIGPYPITMRLYEQSQWEKGDIVGHYFYDERPHSLFTLKLMSYTAINAKGSMDMVLYEYTAKGKHTGTFAGQYECRGDYYAGTFTNSKGQQFHFVLK